MDRFRAAPWPTFLKVTSLIATVVLGVAGYVTFMTIPHGTRVPFAESFGTLISFVPPLIALVAALFVVVAYELDGTDLRVRRLLWSTRVPLSGITRAWHDESAMKGSLRVFGNGGLYSVTGLYQNRALGRYRAFVTNPKHAVVLALPKRVVVVSPADPRAFLEQLRTRLPGLRVDNDGDTAGTARSG
jgi:hypothetical protein